MGKVQNNLLIVLGRLAKMTADDQNFANEFAIDLNNMLDEIANYGGFGKEQQNDPRGDFRDGEWSLLEKVQ